MATAKIDVKTDLHKSDKKLDTTTKSMKGLGTQAKKSGESLKKAGKVMTVAGAAIIGSIGLMVKKYVEAGDAIDKMSKRTGFSATALSELAHAADISGSSLDDIEKGIKRMGSSIEDAADGLATTKIAFQKLGVSIDDIRKMSPEEQFATLSEAIASIEDPTKKAALAQDIFGRAGTNLLPLFAEGADGLKKLREEAHTLGIVFDKEAAAGAATLLDEQTRLKKSFQGVSFALAETIVPALSKFAEKITGVVTKISAWMKEHPKLAEGILKVTGAVGGLMLVFGPLLIILPKLVSGFVALKKAKLGSALAGQFKGLNTQITGISGVLKKVPLIAAAAFAGWKVGKAIGEVKVLGKSVNEHIIGAFTGAKSKIDDATIAKGKLRGEAFKLWKELKDKTGPGVKDLKDKVIKLNSKIFDAAGKVRILKNEMKVLKTPMELLEQAVEDATDKMSDFPVVLEGVPGTIEGILDSINFGKVGEDAAAAGLESSIELANIGADLEKATADQLKAMETQAEKTEKIIEGIASNIGDIFGRAAIDILEGQRTLGESIGDIWKGIKSTIFGVIGDIVKEFVTNLVKSVLTGAVNMGSAMTKAGGVMAKTGKAISGIGEGIGKLIENLAKGIGKALEALAKSIANAARSLAAAAPQIAIVGAIALALFAGFSAIKAIFAKGGGKAAGKSNDLLQDIRDKTFDIFNGAQWMWKAITGEQQNRLQDLAIKAGWNLDATEGILGYQEAIKDNLDRIVDNTEDMVKELKKIPKSASGGFFDKPSLTFVAEKEPEVIIPQSKLKQFFTQFGPTQTQSEGGGSRQPLTINLYLNGRKVAEAIVNDLKELSRLGTLTLDQQGIVRVET